MTVYHIDSDNIPVVPVTDSNGNPIDFSTATRFVAEHFGETNFTVDTDINPGAITGGADGLSLNYSGLAQLNTVVISRDYDTITPLTQIDRSTPTASAYYNITFSDDGLKMFTLQQGNPAVHLWTLTTAWDISTATETATTFAINSLTRSMTFKPDGLKMWGADNAFNNGSIEAYTLTAAYDITTASYDGTGGDFSVPGLNQNCAEVKFKPDGTKMYIVQNFPYRLHQYTLVTPWDITTATADAVTPLVLVADVDNSTDWNIAFLDDGLSLFELTDSAGQGLHLWRYDLATAWDISTASAGIDLGTLTGNILSAFWGLFFAPTPEPYFYVADQAGFIQQYSYVLNRAATPIEALKGCYMTTITVYDAVTPNGRFITHECCGPYLCLEIC